jgi:hypothetical protein
LSDSEELKSAHFLAKIFFNLYQEEEFIKKGKAGRISAFYDIAIWKSFLLLIVTVCTYCVLVFGFALVIEFIEMNNILRGLLGTLLFIILLAYPMIAINWNIILLKIKLRKSKKKKQALEKHLEELSLSYEIYNLMKQSYEIAFEDATGVNFVPFFFTEFLSEMLFKHEDPLLIENIKRIAFNIANTNFILESLNLQDIIANNTLQKNLYSILDAFQFLHTQQIADDDNPALLEILQEINNSIVYVDGIIQTLNKVVTDKKFVEHVDSNTQKMRELIKDQAVAKSNIKSIRTPSGLDRDQFISTLSALDEEVIEIRTRAGTYYASLSNVQHKDAENREIGLSTDKELELRLEVLNNTLDMLEREKGNLSEDEYKRIKKENQNQLIDTKKILDKRRGKSKQIICPYCQNPCSSITDSCKICKNKLPYCIVCLNSIGVGEKVNICPHCKSYAHADHFIEWLKETKSCPYCKHKIRRKLDEISLEAFQNND